MNIEITGEGDCLISPKIDEIIKNFSVTTENGKTTFSVTGEEASVDQTSEEKTLDATIQEMVASKGVAPEHFASKEPAVKTSEERISKDTEQPNCADCRAEYRERIKYVEPEYSKETRSEETMCFTETCAPQKSQVTSEKCVQCIGTCGIGKEIFRWFSCGAAVAFGAVALALMAFKKKD